MITYTFDDDIIQIVTDYFTTQNVQCDPADLDTMLFRFYNYNSRLIPIHPRVVERSKGLSQAHLDNEVASALWEIERKFSAGENLNPHLSTRLSKPDYSDALFCDLGIQHLHFHPRPTRSSDLLFCFVTEDKVYFIDVMAHNRWSEERLFEILCDNWPEALSESEIRGAIGVKEKITTMDVELLRKAHVNIIRERNGKLYGGLGTQMTMSGHSVYGVTRAIAIKHEYRELKRHFSRIETEIRKAVESVTGTAPEADLSFGLRKENARTLVFENNTGAKISTIPIGWKLASIG